MVAEIKFKDIKAGDTVYIKKEVSFGWNSSQDFQIPAKVERVTATTFIVDGRKFKKDNGLEFGKYASFANPIGVDETSKMVAFEEKMKLIYKLQKAIKEIKIYTGTPIEKLVALDTAIQEFNAKTPTNPPIL